MKDFNSLQIAVAGTVYVATLLNQHHKKLQLMFIPKKVKK